MSPSRRPSKQPPPVARWLPAILAVGALLIVVIVAALSGGKDSGASASDSLTSATGVTPSGSGPADPGTAHTADTSDNGYEVTGLTVPQSTIPSIESGSTLPAADKTTINRSCG